VAYRCWSDLCLADMSGRLLTRLALGFQPPQALPPDAGRAPASAPNAPYPWSFALAWSPDGQRLALATAATDQRGAAALRLLAREGQVMATIGLGPDGAVDAPQWRPDSKTLLLTIYPLGGRRIVAVDAVRGSAIDLTQPHWDAFGSLAPDGEQLLLWNGRGAGWIAPVDVPATPL
jgi:dipeptidyl aminopeptidase/acylaminoacyl peptidase